MIDDWYRWALYVLAIAINLTAMALFWSRVRRPGWSARFGWLSLEWAIPALILGIAGIATGQAAAGWLAPLGWVSFALFSWVLDHLLHVEFRRPGKPMILVPYLVLFYGSTLYLTLLTYRLGFLPWLMAAVTYVAMTTASLWSRRVAGY